MRIMWVLLLPIAFVSSEAYAQSEVSTDMIYECSSIEDDVDRLACFDDTVNRFRAAEISGQVTTISKSDVEQLNRETFGLSLPSLPKSILPKFGSNDSPELNSIFEPVATVSRLRYENLQVTLENGQVWEQTDSKQVNFSKKRGVETAEIKRAAFGSFKMKLDGGRAFRVKRVR